MEFLTFIQQGRFAELGVGLVILTARTIAYVFVLPIFSSLNQVSRGVRFGLAIALALPVVPTESFAQVLPDDLAPLALFYLIGSEVLIGVGLGLLVGLPYWIATFVGDIIDMQRGADMATLYDPASGGEQSVLGTFFYFILLALVLGSDLGLQVVFGPIYASHAALFPGSGLPDGGVSAADLGLLLHSLLLSALGIALPVVLVLLFLELVIGFVSRYSPNFNAMLMSMTIKQLLFLGFLYVSFGPLGEVLLDLAAENAARVEAVMEAIE